jgi:hypothetical protein
MTDHWLLYWASDRDWWLSAIQGAVGALIGFMGLYLVYKITQKTERENQAEQRDFERKVQAEQRDFERKVQAEQRDFDRKVQADQRTFESVASVLDTILKVRRMPEHDWDGASSIAHQLQLFCLRELQDHPNAAKWAMKQSEDLMESIKPDEHFLSFGWQSDHIFQSLFDWVNKGLPADYLVPSSSRPQRDQYLASLDPSLHVTRAESWDSSPDVQGRVKQLLLATGKGY